MAVWFEDLMSKPERKDSPKHVGVSNFTRTAGDDSSARGCMFGADRKDKCSTCDTFAGSMEDG